MAVKINNINRNDNLILLDRCPQILSIDKNSMAGSKAKCTIRVTTSASEGKRIIINGNTVIATEDINQSFSNKFYCKNNNNRVAVALCAALNNISNLVKNYNIYVKSGTVVIEARQSGVDYNISVDLNECGYTTNKTDSTDVSAHLNRYYIDIFDDTNYITTLQKINNINEQNKIRFNLSNVLKGITVDDDYKTIKCNIYSTNGITLTTQAADFNLNIAKGYYANHGKTYLDLTVDILPYNNSYPYYIFENKYYISSFKESLSLTADFQYSDESSINTQTFNLQKGINEITFNSEYFKKAYFINLTVSNYTIKLIKINPPFAQEDYTRIYWHNSYGGINAFDFVGDKTIQRETDIVNYYSSDLNFYDEGNKIGNENIKEITLSEKITLTTHLMDENEMQILEDLRLTEDAWIEEDNKKYKIIITNITYTKVNNNFATANVTFRYSLTNFN